MSSFLTRRSAIQIAFFRPQLLAIGSRRGNLTRTTPAQETGYSSIQPTSFGTTSDVSSSTFTNSLNIGNPSNGLSDEKRWSLLHADFNGHDTACEALHCSGFTPDVVSAKEFNS